MAHVTAVTPCLKQTATGTYLEVQVTSRWHEYAGTNLLKEQTGDEWQVKHSPTRSISDPAKIMHRLVVVWIFC